MNKPAYLLDLKIYDALRTVEIKCSIPDEGTRKCVFCGKDVLGDLPRHEPGCHLQTITDALTETL